MIRSKFPQKQLYHDENMERPDEKRSIRKEANKRNDLKQLSNAFAGPSVPRESDSRIAIPLDHDRKSQNLAGL